MASRTLTGQKRPRPPPPPREEGGLSSAFKKVWEWVSPAKKRGIDHNSTPLQGNSNGNNRKPLEFRRDRVISIGDMPASVRVRNDPPCPVEFPESTPQPPKPQSPPTESQSDESLDQILEKKIKNGISTEEYERLQKLLSGSVQGQIVTQGTPALPSIHRGTPFFPPNFDPKQAPNGIFYVPVVAGSVLSPAKRRRVKRVPTPKSKRRAVKKPTNRAKVEEIREEPSAKKRKLSSTPKGNHPMHEYVSPILDALGDTIDLFATDNKPDPNQSLEKQQSLIKLLESLTSKLNDQIADKKRSTEFKSPPKVSSPITISTPAPTLVVPSTPTSPKVTPLPNLQVPPTTQKEDSPPSFSFTAPAPKSTPSESKGEEKTDSTYLDDFFSSTFTKRSTPPSMVLPPPQSPPKSPTPPASPEPEPESPLQRTETIAVTPSFDATSTTASKTSETSSGGFSFAFQASEPKTPASTSTASTGFPSSLALGGSFSKSDSGGFNTFGSDTSSLSLPTIPEPQKSAKPVTKSPVFGENPIKPAQSSPLAPGGFNFNSNSTSSNPFSGSKTSDTSAGASQFTFGSNPSTSATNSNTGQSTGFSFGSTFGGATSSDSTKPMGGFSSNATSGFSFGGTNSGPTSGSTSGSTFGSNTGSASGSGGFSFGSSNAGSTSGSTSSTFGSNLSSTTSGSAFGSNPGSTSQSGSGGFSFGGGFQSATSNPFTSGSTSSQPAAPTGNPFGMSGTLNFGSTGSTNLNSSRGGGGKRSKRKLELE